jgi:hypothetical protein
METSDALPKETLPAGLPDVLALLDDLEAELAARPAIPVGDVVAVDPVRMRALTTRLREALARIRDHPLDEATYHAQLQQAEATATLLSVDAAHKAQMLLDGERVKKLRQAQIAAIVDESRQRGEAQVAEAYAYGEARMREVLSRAEEAHGSVRAALDAVRIAGPGAAQRLVGVARRLVGGRGSGGLAGAVACLLRR